MNKKSMNEKSMVIENKNKGNNSTTRRSSVYGVILTITLMFFVLSCSIHFPLVCRSFYYVHIDALHLDETTEWTKEEITEAYDEMMDFCMKGEEFGTGVLKWSQDGMEHFADCAKLFRLDLRVLDVTTIILIVCFFLYRRGLRPALLLNHGPLFWAGTLLMAVFAIIAALAAMDFDRAFIVFHHLFFPGKTNWIFYYDVDEIIQVLPEVFFRNCAILVVVILFAFCLAEIFIDLHIRKKEK